MPFVVQVAVFMLEMRQEGCPSVELKRAMTSAVLQHLITFPKEQDSSMDSNAAPSVSSVSAADLSPSQRTAVTRSSVLLLSILARMESYLPCRVPFGSIRAVATVLKHCESSQGLLALESCSSLELRFILDTLSQQASSSNVATRGPLEVRAGM